MERKKSLVSEESRLTIVCTDKQTVSDILKKSISDVKARRGGRPSKEPIIYFHRDGNPGMRFSMSPERKKELTRQLRDENIRIAEERGRNELVENFKDSIKIDLTPAQIRTKLKGGSRGR